MVIDNVRGGWPYSEAGGWIPAANIQRNTGYEPITGQMERSVARIRRNEQAQVRLVASEWERMIDE